MSAHIPKCRCLACQERREKRWLEELRESYLVQDRMLAVICKVEWQHETGDGGDAPPRPWDWCPCCGGVKQKDGHTTDCRLDAVLKSRRIA